MRKKYVAILLVVVVLMVGVGVYIKPISMVKAWLNKNQVAEIVDSSQVPTEDGIRNTVLYYKDDKGLLVPVMRKIPWEEGIAKATLRKLVDTEENRLEMDLVGLTPVLPANTQIKGMNISDGVCTVDLNSGFLNFASHKEEAMVLNSIVYTLTEFNTIDKVKFMIEGKDVHKFEFGTNVALDGMARRDINYLGESSNEDKVVVYYEGTINGLESYFVPVTLNLDENNQTGVALLDVLDTLVAGPPEGSGLYSDIPDGTKVIGVDVNDNIACINLSAEISEIEDDMDLALKVSKYFALTIKEINKDVTGVKLYKEGKELDLEKEESDVALPTFANEY